MFLASRLVCGAGLVLGAVAGPVLGGESPTDGRDFRWAFHRGDYPRAIELARERLRAQPRDVDAQIVQARAEAALGRFEAAYEGFQSALRLDARSADALYYLGLTAGVLAEAEYKRLLSLAPDSARAHQVMAESYRAQDRPAKAEAEWKEALEKQPGSVEVLVALGDLTRSKSRFEEALAYYTRAVAVAPRQYDALYGLGVCHSYRGQQAKAAESFRAALRVDASSASAHLGLGISLLQTGKVEEAVAEFQAAATLEPKMRQAYYQLGRAFRALGRNAEAEAAMAKFQELLRDEMDSDEGARPADPP
jgi:tetratricopeptide (TPR) repeat protein